MLHHPIQRAEECQCILQDTNKIIHILLLYCKSIDLPWLNDCTPTHNVMADSSDYPTVSPPPPHRGMSQVRGVYGVRYKCTKCGTGRPHSRSKGSHTLHVVKSPTLVLPQFHLVIVYPVHTDTGNVMNHGAQYQRLRYGGGACLKS